MYIISNLLQLGEVVESYSIKHRIFEEDNNKLAKLRKDHMRSFPGGTKTRRAEFKKIEKDFLKGRVQPELLILNGKSTAIIKLTKVDKLVKIINENIDNRNFKLNIDEFIEQKFIGDDYYGL